MSDAVIQLFPNAIQVEFVGVDYSQGEGFFCVDKDNNVLDANANNR